MGRFLQLSLPNRYTITSLFTAMILLLAGFYQTANYAYAAVTWASPTALSTTNYLQGIRYGGGEWLALGISNTIATSSNGKSWSVHNPNSGVNEWSDAVFNGSNWVMVGSGGKIFTSFGSSAATDSGWSPQASQVTVDLWGIAYNGATYVVVGDSGTILTSSNGTIWSKQTSPDTGSSFMGVTYANGLFVAVCDTGKIYTSADGTSWTLRATSTSPLYGVGYGNGKYVAVGINKIYNSSNGMTWNSVTITGDFYSVDYGNGKFVVVGGGGKILSSVDGSDWSGTETSNTTKGLYAVRYSSEQSRFVAVGGDGSSAVVRTQSNNNNLSNLSLSTGTLTPVFASGTTSYSTSVTSDVASLKVTPTAADSDATIQVRINSGAYMPVTSGQASNNLNLNVGVNTVEVYVLAPDGTTNTTYTISVTRTAPYATPTDIALSNTQIAENSAVGTVIGTISATDPDPGETFTYSLVSGDTGSFTIAGNQLKSNAIFDYETKSSYSITIRVTDAGSAYYEKPFTIQVTNVNEAPTVSNSSKNGTEDTDVVFAAGDFTTNFHDGENDTLSKIQIVNLPANGKLKLNGTEVTANLDVMAVDLGNLKFVPDLNWNGSTGFTWLGYDGTEYSADTATLTLTILPVNDEPTISSIANQTIREDEQSNPLPFTIGDEESAADQLTVTVTSSNQALIPNSNLSLEGTGAARSLRMRSAPNLSGTSTITITVSDGTNTVTQTFDLTVQPVNDPPVAQDGKLSVTQNQAKKGTFQASDIENDALTYSIVSQGTKGTVTVDSNTGVFTYTPNPNETGTDSFTFKVNDGTDDSNTATIEVTISRVYVPVPPNQAPTISGIASQTINEDDKTPVLSFTVSDPDSDVSSLSVTASSNNQKLVPDANIALGGSGANRTVQVTPSANQNGAATITIVVSDGQLTARGTFVVTVRAVNDPPVASNDVLLVKDDKTTTKGTLTAIDVDRDPLTYILVGKPTKGTVTITNAKTGAYTYKPTKGKSGDDSFTFKVNDGVVDSNVATVIVTRSAMSNADLRALSVSSGTMEPEFAANHTDYKVHVQSNVKEISVTPVTLFSTSTVKVNGKPVTSGQASAPISLKVGQNEVNVVVKAQDGTEKSYTITVERDSIQITEIKLDKSSVTLMEGDKPIVLTATIQPEEAKDSQLVWNSSKPSVATVDEKGKVVPLAEGSTIITVSSPDGKVKDTCNVKVKAGEVLELVADPAMLVMKPDDTESIRISAFFGNESKRDITNKVTWTSEDQKVATVSKGKVRAKATGTTRIVATYKGKKVSILVKVYKIIMVDEREVKVSFSPSGNQFYKLTVSGTILTKDNPTVQVVIGNKTYSAKVDKDKKTFGLQRTLKWTDGQPTELQLQIKSKASKKNEQIITLPLLLFDSNSIEIEKNTDDGDQTNYTITGQLFNPMFVMKVEAIGEDGTSYLGTLEDDRFEIPLHDFTGGKATVRVVSFTGMAQEWEIGVE